MIWIYDIETYKNYFSVIFKNPDTKEIKEFIIFDKRSDLDGLYRFIIQNDWLIGYNSFHFDNQLLNYIYKAHGLLTFKKPKEIARSIYNLASMIVNHDYSDLKYRLPFRFLDLMKLGGFQKSLKLLGVSMKWPKLQDLPIEWDKEIEAHQVDTIRKYNLNDVLITEQLYHKLMDKIKLRADISKKYDVNVYTEPDSGIANRLLEKFYSETTGLALKDFRSLRTDRKFMKFDWVIFDEIDFHTNTFISLLEDLKQYTYYKAHPFFKKKVTYNGVTYQLGIGGIHSIDKGAMFEEDEENFIIDADITSMYPALMINHNLTPEHLGSKFMVKFKELRDRRLTAKKNGNKDENESLKIVLNSTYGKTKSEHHWLYDPMVALQTTINGQLYILMLIESLGLHDFQVISANTDGVTTIVPKDRLDEYKKLCATWERKTNFDLEYAYYSKYARRDVNNYIAIYQDGKVKTKGVFINEIDLMKGFDKPIISLALYEFFVNDTPIRETILNHKDIYDFCIAKKIDAKFTNEYHYLKDGGYKVDVLQKSVRYYVSNDGGSLLKTNRKENVINQYEAGKNVTVFNDYVDKPMSEYDLNYAYYIHATQKIINEIIKQQLTLF